MVQCVLDKCNCPARHGPCKEEHGYRDGKKEMSQSSVRNRWNKIKIRPRQEEKKTGPLSLILF